MKQLNIIWLLLMILTFGTAFISGRDINYATLFIIGIAGLKFILVSFEFMELKKAHVLWKYLILGFLGGFSALLLFIV
ncbi:MAG: cytochrome C oxidase subunit IV family protein [Flavobacteriaceae bacterium]|nr:cytochrome C oxidase subunit IV family protein [Flavobacteriaceae bacterium]